LIALNSSKLFELYDAEYSYRIERDKFKEEEKTIVSLVPTFQVLSAALPHYCIIVVDGSLALCEDTKKRIKVISAVNCTGTD
jgi:hypothetical protein